MARKAAQNSGSSETEVRCPRSVSECFSGRPASSALRIVAAMRLEAPRLELGLGPGALGLGGGAPGPCRGSVAAAAGGRALALAADGAEVDELGRHQMSLL
jgi:hypothetical protein